MDKNIVKNRLDKIMNNYRLNKKFSTEDYLLLANILITNNNLDSAKRLYKKISLSTGNIEHEKMYQHLINITNIENNFNISTLTLI